MRVLSRPGWVEDSTMKRTRHTAEQIIRKLKIVADGCREFEVTQPTYHRGDSNTAECRPRRPCV